MSDTPRTDNCLTEILDAYGYVHQGNCPQRWVNHARELERELNAANQRIQRLDEFVDQLTNPRFTRDDLPKEALLQRIKRLEEAGNAIVDHNIGCGCGQDGPCRACRMACEAWYKAKEAKP